MLNDPLLDNTPDNKWTSSPDCIFKDGTYYITAKGRNAFTHSCASSINFNNFTYQVLMTINAGDGGGIVFRSDGEYKCYPFWIAKDGRYIFRCHTSRSDSTALEGGYASAFNQGLAKPNVIAVVARGNNFDLYINFQHILYATDNTFTQGMIGVSAVSLDNTLTKVEFSNAKVWSL